MTLKDRRRAEERTSDSLGGYTNYPHIKPMITRVSIGIFRLTKTRDIHYNVEKGR